MIKKPSVQSDTSERNATLLKVYADLVQLHPNNETYIKQYAELLLQMGQETTGIKILCHLHDLFCAHHQHGKADALAKQYAVMGRMRESKHWQEGVQSLLPSFTRNRLWLRLHQQRLSEGQHLFYTGDPLDTLYLVCKGELAEFLEAGDGSPVLLGLIQPGDVVAENKLLNAGLHKVDVVANKPSIIVKLPRKKMLDALAASPLLKNALARKVENRRLMRLLSSSALLQSIPFEMRQHMAEESYMQTHAKGSMIYKAGEKLDHVAILIKGEAHYQLHHQGTITQLDYLKAGALIGESVGLHEAGCSADLVAKTGVSMVHIAYAAFIHVVEAYPPLRKTLTAATEVQRSQLMGKLNELQTQEL